MPVSVVTTLFVSASRTVRLLPVSFATQTVPVMSWASWLGADVVRGSFGAEGP